MIFVTVFAFQLIVSLINKSSMRSILGSAQEWYERDSAEKTANLTTTSFELLIESVSHDGKKISSDEAAQIIKALDILFTQQQLQRNTEEMCILVKRNNKVYAVDDGSTLFDIMFLNSTAVTANDSSYNQAIQLFNGVGDDLASNEQIRSIITNTRTFNTFVPMIVRGQRLVGDGMDDKKTKHTLTWEAPAVGACAFSPDAREGLAGRPSFDWCPGWRRGPQHPRSRATPVDGRDLRSTST